MHNHNMNRIALLLAALVLCRHCWLLSFAFPIGGSRVESKQKHSQQRHSQQNPTRGFSRSILQSLSYYKDHIQLDQSLTDHRTRRRTIKTRSALVQNDFFERQLIVTDLRVIDMFSVLKLTSQEFFPNCSNVYEKVTTAT